MTDISVIIPSYNAQEQIPQTLQALSEQSIDPARLEVIVVDCSDTSALEDVAARFDNVRVHRVQERFNPGIGRNIGADLASGKLLVFLDADVVLQRNALQQAWDYYCLGHRIFGGCLELNESGNPPPSAYLEHYFFNHESHRLRPPSERSNLSSALMLFDRDIFLREGGFKDLPRMQDTELTERVRRKGHHLSFTPSVLGYQTQDAPLPKVLRKVFINGKNLYYIRYHDKGLGTRLLLGATLPALSAFKMLRIMGRHLRYQDPRGRLIALGLTPLLSVAGVSWMLGLYSSMLGGQMSDRRD